MPIRAEGGVISSNLPSYNPSLPFLLCARCHPKRGSNEHLTSEKWDGAVDPAGIVMRDDGEGGAFIVLNHALPLSNQNKRK